MTKQEAKAFILKEWEVSSGERITEMVKRYWKLEKKENIVAAARKIFGE